MPSQLEARVTKQMAQATQSWHQMKSSSHTAGTSIRTWWKTLRHRRLIIGDKSSRRVESFSWKWEKLSCCAESALRNLEKKLEKKLQKKNFFNLEFESLWEVFCLFLCCRHDNDLGDVAWWHNQHKLCVHLTHRDHQSCGSKKKMQGAERRPNANNRRCVNSSPNFN